jgi:hypothetical protein
VNAPTPQQEEVSRLKARYEIMLNDPEKSDLIKILHTALADRMLVTLPGKDVPLFPPQDNSIPPIDPTC